MEQHTESVYSSIQEQLDERVCPITLEPFVDPVLLGADGFTYERAAIEKWIGMGKRLTPMRFRLNTRPILIPNRDVTDLKTAFKDPILVRKNGKTYEHTELLGMIEVTICKHKPIILEGIEYFMINCYSNKALWQDQYSQERRPFVMPLIEGHSISISALVRQVLQIVSPNRCREYQEFAANRLKYFRRDYPDMSFQQSAHIILTEWRDRVD